MLSRRLSKSKYFRRLSKSKYFRYNLAPLVTRKLYNNEVSSMMNVGNAVNAAKEIFAFENMNMICFIINVGKYCQYCKGNIFF